MKRFLRVFLIAFIIIFYSGSVAAQLVPIDPDPDPITGPDDQTLELEVVGSSTQTTVEFDTEDITYTLKLTNSGNTQLNVTLSVSGDVNTATLSKDLFFLQGGNSEDVTLTLPRTALLNLGTYEVQVVASEFNFGNTTGSANLLASATTETIVSNAFNIKLESVGSLTQTSTTSDTEDIIYTLRITNRGEALDQAYLTVSGDLEDATLDSEVVAFEPKVFKVVTLTLPRTALSIAGTYSVEVKATSENDSAVTATIITKTIITPGESERPGSTPDLTPPEQTTHQVILSEFMFETGGGEAALPQWIEVYNNSRSAVNLRGWKLHWNWKRSTTILLEATTTFDEDFHIPPQQMRLIVTTLDRHSGGGKLSDDSVYQLPSLRVEGLTQEIIENHIQHITGSGFSLKLLNPEDVLIDQIGTLNGDKKTWELPESLIDGVRSSLIRRFDEEVPRSGLERRGWIRAVDVKRLVAGIYYGSPNDLGTPGYRRGKPLPVRLSQFTAKFVKDEVVISWTTESELDNAGFNIYRSTSPTKNFQRINTKLIQGAGTTGERNTYQFIDKTAKPNVSSYYYRIEDIDLSGTRGILTTYRLRGVIAPTGKHITTWGTLKNNR